MTITKPDSKKFWTAVATLVGTIIGVGIFGVPYALGKVGLLLGLVYFFMLGGIQLLQHLFYAEVAIATPEKLRLVGLAEKFLGPKARRTAAVASIFGFWGAMIAYVLVGGSFLHTLLGPSLGGSVMSYQLIWGLIGAVAIYGGLELVAKLELWMTAGLVVALAVIVGYCVPHLDLANVSFFTVEDFFLPYGIILFSLNGMSAIPEMEDEIGSSRDRFRMSIVAGTLIATVLTAVFGLAVLGVSGANTSEDSLAGLKGILGNGFVTVMAVFGFLAVATSFFTSGLNLRESFEYDYKISRLPAWLLAAGVPIIALLAGADSFVNIIGFTGAVFGGIVAILVALMYVAVTKKKAVTERPLGLPVTYAYLSIAVLSVGALYEIATTVIKIIVE